MMTRVTKVLIGKDITRTASIVNIYADTPQPAEGEILVLDKFKKPLAAGSTVADSDVIYLCQGLGSTYNYTNEAGTTVTGARKLKFSDPIEGAKVRMFKGLAYDAKAEKVITFAAITSPLTVGTEYVLRIVYKDIHEKRGQFTKTYRFIGTDTSSQTVFNGLRAAIAADSGARVAGSGTTTLILTGLAISACTTGLTDIDNFSMVDFEPYLTYIDSDGNHAAITGAAKTYTTALDYGQGNWENVRDLEKSMWGYEGITNRTQFPVITPSQCTVKDETYDTIIIEHDKSYLSPDNQYVKQAPMTTLICIPNTTGSNQMSDILARLNPWMASCPGAFTNVTF